MLKEWICAEDMTLPVTPVPKGRPRATAEGNFVRMYTPKKTQEFESEVAQIYSLFRGKKHSGPLMVFIDLHFAPNKSEVKAVRNRMLAGEIHHVKKPDIDNCAKSILDALNGLAYDDDSQIVGLNLNKSYAAESEIVLKIYEWRE